MSCNLQKKSSAGTAGSLGAFSSHSTMPHLQISHNVSTPIPALFNEDCNFLPANDLCAHVLFSELVLKNWCLTIHHQGKFVAVFCPLEAQSPDSKPQ